MLKKLVKYGNSNALVLDRTILSLLGINEGSFLKLRIEGDALIIKKAEEELKSTDSLMVEMETIHDRLESTSKSPIREIAEENTRAFCKKVEKDPAAMEELKSWLPGTENAKKLEKEYQRIMEKYQEDLKPLSSKEFQDELQEIAKKYEGNATSKEYMEEIMALRVKFAPKVAMMDKEMKEVSTSLGYPASLS